MNILLGVSGSVAAIKCWELAKAFENIGQVRIVQTKTGKFFGKINTRWPLMPSDDFIGTIYTDEDEWKWHGLGDHILHIDLKDWADILVIAPLSANTLAKICNGLCDNLLTSIYRAWPINKPIVLAPAMNTDMWNNPITQTQLNMLKLRQGLHSFDGFCIVNPVEKKLACGVHGIGAMASIESIVEAVKIYG